MGVVGVGTRGRGGGQGSGLIWFDLAGGRNGGGWVGGRRDLDRIDGMGGRGGGGGLIWFDLAGGGNGGAWVDGRQYFDRIYRIRRINGILGWSGGGGGGLIWSDFRAIENGGEFFEAGGVFDGGDGGGGGGVEDGVALGALGGFECLDGVGFGLSQFGGGLFAVLAGALAAEVGGVMEGFLEGEDVAGEVAQEFEFGLEGGGGFAIPGVEQGGIAGGEHGGEVVGEGGGVGEGGEGGGGVVEGGGVLK